MIKDNSAKLTTFVFDDKPYQVMMAVGKMPDGKYSCEITYRGLYYFGVSSVEDIVRQTVIGRLERRIRNDLSMQKTSDKFFQNDLKEIWQGVNWENVQ